MALIVLQAHLLVVLRLRLEAESDSLLRFVHLDDLEIHLVPYRKKGLIFHGRCTAPSYRFRDNLRPMTQSFYTRQQFDKHPELGSAAHLAANSIANLVRLEESLPSVGLQLLHAK